MYEWRSVDCDFIKKTSDCDFLLPFQIKMKNAGYDVDATGCLDLKTIIAQKQFSKDEKKRLRLKRKQQRKQEKLVSKSS